MVPGTVESAPARFRGGRVVLLTTIVSALLYGAWYILSVLKLALHRSKYILQIMPDFK